MDGNENSRKVFEEQMQWMLEVTGKKTQAELADFLGIPQAFISDAKRRGKIPEEWLEAVMRVKNATQDS